MTYVSMSPLGGSTAWTVPPAQRFATVERHELAADARHELDAAVAGTTDARSVFLAADIHRRLTQGPGYLVIRGLPGGVSNQDRCAAIVSWIMRGLGRVLPQNTQRDPLYEVIDRADPRGFYGGSRGTDALLDHTDQAAAPEELLPQILVLMCIQPARSGGESVLTSGHALHDRLLHASPEHAAALYEPLPFARPPDGTSDAPATWSTVFARTAQGMRVRYNRYFVELGANEAGIDLTPEQVEALDITERLLAQPACRAVVPLRAGDLLVVDNTAILHNRLAYTDSTTANERRRLLRGWVRTAAPLASTAA